MVESSLVDPTRLIEADPEFVVKIFFSKNIFTIFSKTTAQTKQ